MILRLLAIPAILWALGFALFAVTLAQPQEEGTTDAIVVPTGAPGRIARGIALIEKGRAKRMLITGVARDVQPGELAEVNRLPRRWFDCCVDLGRAAVDTRSNAQETAHWIERRDYRTIRLVTTDWHMARARHELARALPHGIEIVPDAVRSDPPFGVLMREYNKLLLAHAASFAGI